jgi:hypothetical protein
LSGFVGDTKPDKEQTIEQQVNKINKELSVLKMPEFKRMIET